MGRAAGPPGRRKAILGNPPHFQPVTPDQVRAPGSDSGEVFSSTSRDRRNRFRASSRLRGEVPPPAMLPSPVSGWQRLIGWIVSAGTDEGRVPIGRLSAVRAEFVSMLDDLDPGRTAMLRQRIAKAASLRDLWHLRSDLYSAVSLQHSQTEAERRVSTLNRHFSGRQPR